MAPAVVVFDLDGTLTDSAPGIVASYRSALTVFGLDPPEGLIRAQIGPPLAEGLAALGVPAAEVGRAVVLYRRHFEATGMYDNRLYDGVADVLGALRDQGARLALATSKLTRFAHAIVAHFGLASLFEVVVGASEDGTRIGKTAIAGHALAALGNPGGASLVGDRRDDMVAACHLGLRAVGAAWGYGSREELVRSGADVIVDAPAGLPAALSHASSNEWTALGPQT